MKQSQRLQLSESEIDDISRALIIGLSAAEGLRMTCDSPPADDHKFLEEIYGRLLRKRLAHDAAEYENQLNPTR